MRNDLGELCGRYAVVEGDVEVMQHADGLIPGNQGRSRDDAAISGGEVRPFPQPFLDAVVRVVFKRGRHLADIFRRQCGPRYS